MQVDRVERKRSHGTLCWLQGIAEPNTVVTADATRRLLGSLFELKDLGSYELKGISASTRAWSVLRPSSVESRFEALRAGLLTALVGREEEMDLLLQAGPRPGLVKDK
jgi:hypothetical protein